MCPQKKLILKEFVAKDCFSDDHVILPFFSPFLQLDLI